MELHCEAHRGSPPILYRFYYDDVFLGSRSATSGGGASFKLFLTAEHSGNYSCEADNGLGAQRSEAITLSVTGRTRLYRPLDDQVRSTVHPSCWMIRPPGTGLQASGLGSAWASVPHPCPPSPAPWLLGSREPGCTLFAGLCAGTRPRWQWGPRGAQGTRGAQHAQGSRWAGASTASSMLKKQWENHQQIQESEFLSGLSHSSS